MTLTEMFTIRYENPEICTQEINSIPAADVAPVVHARWVSVAGKRDRICSRCLHNEPYKNADDDADMPSISAEMVERFIDHHETMTMGGKTTVVRAVLKNGFTIVESSSCVSAENYDEKMGEKICMEKIRDKVWELLGFLLQTAVEGVKGVPVLDLLAEDAE